MVVEGAGWPKGFVCKFLAPASMLMQDDHNNVWCLPTVSLVLWAPRAYLQRICITVQCP